MPVLEGAGFPAFIRLVGHPLRWQLVSELAGSDLRVRELVGRVAESQNLVSYHLRVLRDGGLVSVSRSSFDARDSYYHLHLDRCAEGLASTGAALHPALRISLPPTAPQRSTPAIPEPRVLFVCSGNSARSPMAEAMLRHRAGNLVRVTSAGTAPKDRIHPHVVRVLREQYGIDIAGQAPRLLDLASGSAFDRVVTLCDKAREVLPGAGDWLHLHWSIPDPAQDARGNDYPRFVSAARDIDTRVRFLLPTLLSPTHEEDRP